MNYISRSLETVVSQVTREYPVVLITGPRQVGKTTMLQRMMEGTDRGYAGIACRKSGSAIYDIVIPEPNTDECHTMAIIACGASNITTIVLLFLGMLFSVPLKPILQNESLQPAFNFAIPALFGGLVAQSIIKSKKQVGLYLIPLAVCLAFCYLTKVEAAYYMLITVALGALVFYLFDYKIQNKQ